MVARGTPLPQQLNPDAILEALLEIRFNAPTILPEVLFGRLAEHAPWIGWQQRRLPTYEIPAPLREADANLRYAPIFEISNPQQHRAVRIGSHVLSYHVMAPYPGWAVFQPEIDSAVDQLFAKATGLTVLRLGLRYINAFLTDAHGITSVADLDVEVKVSDDDHPSRMNLNFMTSIGPDADCTVRIATKEFAQGAVPTNAAVIADIDIFTNDHITAQTAQAVKDWAVMAHNGEKQEFFHLLTQQTIAHLTQGG
jgi:uncharacterized protein (TIGR04255 family)